MYQTAAEVHAVSQHLKAALWTQVCYERRSGGAPGTSKDAGQAGMPRQQQQQPPPVSPSFEPAAGRGCPDMLIFVGSQAALLRAAEASPGASFTTPLLLFLPLPTGVGRSLSQLMAHKL